MNATPRIRRLSYGLAAAAIVALPAISVAQEPAPAPAPQVWNPAVDLPRP